MRKSLLIQLILAFSASAHADGTVTCQKSYFDFTFSNSYLSSIIPSDFFEIGDALAAEYNIDYDTSKKTIKRITVKNKSPQVKLVFTQENSKITHTLKKQENRDEEFCSSNECRENYEYIHAEMNDPDMGEVASVTIQIDSEIVYPDQISSNSTLKVGSRRLSVDAEHTDCDGTILLERMDTSNLDAELLE